MDPHINPELDRDPKDTTYQSNAASGSHRSMHHHASPAHRIASPQSHLHSQGPPHPIMPPQRQAYYGPGSPEPPTASSAAVASSSAPHYRRPSSPIPYGNPPPSAYSSSSVAPASSHPAHYSSNQPYGRHPDYVKEDYRYAQQDRRREYESAEHGHDYPPMARDHYRSSSPPRLHHPHPTRDPPLVPTARRPPSAGVPVYPVHQGPASSSTHGPIYDQELHDRDRRAGHPYSGSSRYSARSPSPGRYGSPPPGNMPYRHYYEQPPHHQQAGHSRAYRQEYYTSDGEGEGGVISQHHHFPQQTHPSRGPSYRSWPAGPHESSSREFPPSAHQV
ncbi:hypothetical protein BGZ49_004954 [Haplosporangium sp. Z 27]|nr:hypothetical protein BGZ49_004954 [Haplosporangium sp. Z 27]